MSVSLKRCAQLKEQAAALQAGADRLAGRQEQLMQQLKTEYGVASLPAAAKLAARLQAEAVAADAAAADALAAFTEEYGDVLGDL